MIKQHHTVRVQSQLCEP